MSKGLIKQSIISAILIITFLVPSVLAYPEWEFITKSRIQYHYPAPSQISLYKDYPYLGFSLYTQKTFQLRDVENFSIIHQCPLPETPDNLSYWMPMVVDDGIIFDNALDDEGNPIVVYEHFDGTSRTYDKNGKIFWDDALYSADVIGQEDGSRTIRVVHLDDDKVVWEDTEKLGNDDKFGIFDYGHLYTRINYSPETSHRIVFRPREIIDVVTGDTVFEFPNGATDFASIYPSHSNDYFFIFYTKDEENPSQKTINILDTINWQVIFTRGYNEKVDGRVNTFCSGRDVYFVQSINDTTHAENLWRYRIEKVQTDTMKKETFEIDVQCDECGVSNRSSFSSMNPVSGISDLYGYFALFQHMSSRATQIIDIRDNRVIWSSDSIYNGGNHGYPCFKENGVVVFRTAGCLKAFDINTMKLRWVVECETAESNLQFDDLVYSVTQTEKGGVSGTHIRVFNNYTQSYEPYDFFMPEISNIIGKHICPSKHGILCLPERYLLCTRYYGNYDFLLFKPGIYEPFYAVDSPFDNHRKWIEDWQYTDNEDEILILTEEEDASGEYVEGPAYIFNIPKGILRKKED